AGAQVALTDTAVGETAVGETAVGLAVRGEAEPAPGAGVPHIALVVRDTVASADWWCRTFGFVSTEQPDQAGGPDRPASPATRRKVVVRHPDSGLVLGFRQRARDSGRGRFEYLSLRVASERALGDWAAHLHRLGIPHSSVRDTGDEQYLSLTAPDGIGLELWWSRPRQTGSRPRDTAGAP
ncbi:MAG: glyoxylase family protein, partial [Pseudonocardiales bacterium]|nr:glyoxylase family protein [Pseudonocardiales bacterium]